MKKQNTPTLADSICDFRVRKIKKQFFTQINTLLDWETISKTIDKYYKKGESASGCSSYDGLLLFKMCLLQTWYGLSDYEVEDRINDSLSFSYFCGLTIEQTAPDHSTLSRFRTAMTKADAYNKLFKAINKQLEDKGILVKKGVLVDASVDKEGAWLKKRGKYHFGYKKHYVTDEEGLVCGVVTTKASVNEVSNLEEILDSADLPEGISVKADKGYQSEKNSEILKKKKLKNHIMKKAKKNKPLTGWEKQFNKLIGKTRFKVERTFGGIKLWFNGGVARYRGLSKMHTQNLMEAICYNLYRSPGIIVSNCEK